MTCRTSAPVRLAPLASSMVLLLSAILAGCSGKDEPQPGKVLDEARLAGRTGASFPQADEDYFKDMDGGIALTPDEVRGRNMWLVWSGGNDRFWTKMTDYTFGTNSVHHTFCSTCGIHACAHGNIAEIGGDFVTVSLACLDDADVAELVAAPVVYADGRNDNWWNPPAETRHL